jgi:hypothetical protein
MTRLLLLSGAAPSSDVLHLAAKARSVALAHMLLAAGSRLTAAADAEAAVLLKHLSKRVPTLRFCSRRVLLRAGVGLDLADRLFRDRHELPATLADYLLLIDTGLEEEIAS